MSLSEKQRRFTYYVSRLIDRAYSMGYEMTFGEAYRTPEQAALNAANGTGIAKSLHTERLAIDLNLFRDGKYLTTTEDWRQLGEWWEQLDSDCRWGGRFSRPDGNHVSLAHDGRA